MRAATEVFIEVDFRTATISDVARAARVAPGTIYLYFEDKEGLFEVAFLRACESPIVARLDLPYRRDPGSDTKSLVEGPVEAIAHFPQLWVAGQQRSVPDAREEYHGILLELAHWISRYRSAVLIAHRNRHAKPELHQAFDRVVWRDVEARLAAYLGSRARMGLLPFVDQPSAAARLVLGALAGSLLGSPIHPVPADAEVAAALVSGLLIPAPVRSGYLPLPSEPMQ